MKKVLFLVILGIVFVGCGEKNLTNNMVLNYEKNLNLGKNESLKNFSILNIPDFKCKKSSEKNTILCESKNISISKDNIKDMVKADNIIIKTNRIYLGDKNGEINLTQAYDDFTKRNFNSEIIIKGFKMDNIMAELFALTRLDPKISFIAPYLKDQYDIILSDTYDLSLGHKATITINNIEKDFILSIDFYYSLDYKDVMNVIDGKKIAIFDINSQYLKIKDDNLRSFFDIFSNKIIENAILSNVSIKMATNEIDKDLKNYLDKLKEHTKKDMINENNETKKQMDYKILQVIRKFEEEKPHTLTIDMEFKGDNTMAYIHKMFLLKSDKDFKNNNIFFKLNGIEYNEFKELY